MSEKKNQVSPAHKSFKNNDLTQKNVSLVPPQSQGELFHIEKQIEIDGVEMGVLDNGLPYLTESGLARMCGIDRKVLNRLASGWDDERLKPRGKTIAQLLDQAGHREGSLFLKSELNGVVINAYTEPVCLAILEYYAFVADEKRAEAQRAFRSLAKVTFRSFVYAAVGYSPELAMLDNWRHFHDRVDLNMNSVPPGHFSVFQEVAGLIVTMIRASMTISDKVIPDLSVGKTWASYWVEHNLNQKFGDRVRYDHNYPEYYPQSQSNPQEAWAYPNSCLAVFREWFQQEYRQEKFPKYIKNQTAQGKIPAAIASKAIAAVVGQALPPPSA